MERRSFLKALGLFTAGVGLGVSRLEFTWSFPFVRRQHVPQVVDTVTAKGGQTIQLSLPAAKKGDMLVAVVASHGATSDWSNIQGWTLVSSEEAGPVRCRYWYKVMENDNRFEFTANGASAVTGQLMAIRGGELNANPTPWP